MANAQHPPPRQPQPQKRPKILRIGVILGDKIVEERLVRDHGPVSIGQSARNTFCVPAPELPRTWKLFQLEGDRYMLAVSDHMDGRISDGGNQPVALSQLKSSGQVKRVGNAWVIPLSDTARGKIIIGDMTLLFQFVMAPPMQPRPQLPHSVRGSIADRIDPYLAVILSVSMVAHLLVWGYFKFVVEEEKQATADVIPDQFASVVIERPKPPPPKETQQPVEEKAKEETKTETKKETKPAGEEKPDKVAIEKKVENAAPLRVLRNLAAKGNGPLGVGANEKEAWEDLDKGLKNVGSGNVVASVGTSGQETRGTTGNAEVASGKEVGVTGPSGPKATGGQKVEQEVKVTGKAEKIEDIDAGGLNPDVVASTIKSRYQQRVNACYQRALKNNPNLGGRVEVSFTVGLAGNVIKASAQGFDSEVDQCITREARTWRFNKPESQAEFVIPFILRRVN